MATVPTAVVLLLLAEEMPLTVPPCTPFTSKPRMLWAVRSQLLKLLNSDDTPDLLRAVPAISRLMTGGERGYTHQWYYDLGRSDILYVWYNKVLRPKFEPHAEGRWTVQIRIRRVPHHRAGSALAMAVLHILNKVAYSRGMMHRPQVVDIAYSIQPYETVAIVLLDGRGVYALNTVRCAPQVRMSTMQQLVVTSPSLETVLSLPNNTLASMCEIVQYLVTPLDFELRGGGIRGIVPRLLDGIPGPEARVGQSNSTITK